MKVYNELSRLPLNQKVTIVYIGDFGGVTILQTIVEKVEQSRHYQNCPENQIGAIITHKPKGKRKFWKTNFDYMKNILVYDGWIKINDDMNWTITKTATVIRKDGKHLGFDVNQLVNIKNGCEHKPLIEINLEGK